MIVVGKTRGQDPESIERQPGPGVQKKINWPRKPGCLGSHRPNSTRLEVKGDEPQPKILGKGKQEEKGCQNSRVSLLFCGRNRPIAPALVVVVQPRGEESVAAAV